MQIDKILIIESPVKLWKLLTSKNEIIDQSANDVYYSITMFMDSVEAYVRGCKCDEEVNYEDMMLNYNTCIIGKEEVVSHLTKGFECDKIEFK
jgi:acetaldehyde dehydrogenase (acetylating)